MPPQRTSKCPFSTSKWRDCKWAVICVSNRSAHIRVLQWPTYQKATFPPSLWDWHLESREQIIKGIFGRGGKNAKSNKTNKVINLRVYKGQGQPRETKVGKLEMALKTCPKKVHSDPSLRTFWDAIWPRSEPDSTYFCKGFVIHAVAYMICTLLFTTAFKVGSRTLIVKAWSETSTERVPLIYYKRICL